MFQASRAWFELHRQRAEPLLPPDGACVFALQQAVMASLNWIYSGGFYPYLHFSFNTFLQEHLKSSSRRLAGKHLSDILSGILSRKSPSYSSTKLRSSATGEHVCFCASSSQTFLPSFLLLLWGREEHLETPTVRTTQ